MMKPKRESTTVNPLARLWHEFLFTREFEYVIQGEPERCAQALKQHLPQMYITKHTPQEYSFVIYSNNGGMVSGSGTLAYDGDQAATLIQGQVQFDMHRHPLVLIVGAVFLIIIAAVANLSNVGGALVGVLTLVLALWWWMSYQDRNRLIDAIHHAVKYIPIYTYEDKLLHAIALDVIMQQQSGQGDDDDTEIQTQGTAS